MNTKAQAIKKLSIGALGIFLSMTIAIVVHAVLPAGIDVSEFDSILVMTFGFPITACLYFFILFVHCSLVTGVFGVKSSLSRTQIALRYGISFALIYIVGMQEIIVEASPFNVWGWDFVRYELIMGLSDALPAILLCFLISFVYTKRNRKVNNCHKMSMAKKSFVIVIFLLLFFIARLIGYRTGIVGSEIDIYPIQTYIWTILFGIVSGSIFLLLYPIYAEKSSILKGAFQQTILTMGLNWIIFNGFMGMIFNGLMPEMLLRTGIDILSWFLAALVAGKFIFPKFVIIKQDD